MRRATVKHEGCETAEGTSAGRTCDGSSDLATGKVKPKMTTALLDKPNTAERQPVGVTSEGESNYLAFKPADEEYGVEILKVRGINRLMNITDVPRMPQYMKGVIHPRGKAIPVIDLRSKFALTATGRSRSGPREGSGDWPNSCSTCSPQCVNLRTDSKGGL